MKVGQRTKEKRQEPISSQFQQNLVLHHLGIISVKMEEIGLQRSLLPVQNSSSTNEYV